MPKFEANLCRYIDGVKVYLTCGRNGSQTPPFSGAGGNPGTGMAAV
jgi:hypothetical protein